jgi:Protein of unknown function with HXXEE motif
MMPSVAPFLTERKLLIVNLGSVLLLFIIATYSALVGHLWFALYAPYVSVINAFMHLGQMVRWRTYNPGLWTAIVLFLPGAAYSILTIGFDGATAMDDLIGFGLGLLAHVFFFALGRGWIGRDL